MVIRSCSRARSAGPAVAVALLGALPCSGIARGQSAGLEEAAEETFEAGMQAMAKGDYERGCPLIEESLRYDPGMAAKFRLAECYERQGRLATAWETYLEVSEEAQAAGMDRRAEFARDRAETIAPRLSSLTIEVPAELAADPDLEVRCDGKLVSRPFWGAPMPIDAGRHRLVVSSPGRGRSVQIARVGGDGETRRVTARLFGGHSSGGEDGSDGATAGPSPLAVTGVAVALAGAGMVGASVGLGLAAKSRYDDGAAHCVESRCDPEGMEVRQAALGQATAATALFVIGASAFVGGGVLWLVAPSGDGASGDAGDGADAVAKLELGVAPWGPVVRGSW